MRNIVILACLMLFPACSMQRWCNQRFPPQIVSDSVYIEKLKEVPIFMEGDTIQVKVPVNCPDQDVATYENVKLRQTIRILNGKLLSQTEIKGDTVKVYVPEIHEKIKTVEIPQPVKFIPKLIKILAYIGGASIALFILWIVLKFVK